MGRGRQRSTRWQPDGLEAWSSRQKSSNAQARVGHRCWRSRFFVCLRGILKIGSAQRRWYDDYEISRERVTTIVARSHLSSLVGREIKTLTGRANKVLRIEGNDVIVATERSPNGQPVPISWVQDALDMLQRDGEVVIDVETVGYRSAFIGAVLASLPGVATAVAPRRVIRSPDSRS